ncbi:hypothetical protein BVRB_034000, partial [Beta vulgaris subsp. vulgaris]
SNSADCLEEAHVGVSPLDLQVPDTGETIRHNSYSIHDYSELSSFNNLFAPSFDPNLDVDFDKILLARVWSISELVG